MRKNIKNTVYEILAEDELARRDDWYLIYKVINKLLHYDYGTAFGQVVQGMRVNGISFESVTRCRRKFLEQYPNLKNKVTEIARRYEEQEYIEEFGHRHIPRID